MATRRFDRARAMVWAAARRQWRLLALALGCSVVAALSEGLTFGVLGMAMSFIQHGRLLEPTSDLAAAFRRPLDPLLVPLSPGRQLVTLIAGMVLLQALRSVLTYFGQVAGAVVGSRVQAEIQRAVYARLLRLAYPCVARFRAGDLSDYVTAPSPALSEIVVTLVLWVVNAVAILAYCVVLILMSPKLFAVAAVLFGFLAWVQKRLANHVTGIAHSLSKVGAQLSQRVVETVHAIRIVHAFGQQTAVARAADAELDRILVIVRRINLWLASTAPLGEILSISTVGAFMVYSYFQLQGDANVLTAVALFIGVLHRLSGRIVVLNLCLSEIVKRLGAVGRLDDFLRDDDKEFSREGGAEFGGLTDAVAFEAASLTYPQRDEPAVREVSFTIPRGRVTALVGGSGAGKSSVADLLLQLYEPTAGRVTADGVSLTAYSLASWRARLGVVSQDTFLFNASVAENIRFGRPDATDAEVEAAAHAACAAEFIAALPQMYDTVLGERGTKLSGGQRQRVALARMILRQPEIVVLDEATSALDGETERKVQAALDGFLRDRTVLVIAHRLSTVAQADQIVVMEVGRVVEVGTHATLLDRSSRYADYWRLHTRTAAEPA